jgi:hypothetical protein
MDAHEDAHAVGKLYLTSLRGTTEDAPVRKLS